MIDYNYKNVFDAKFIKNISGLTYMKAKVRKSNWELLYNGIIKIG
jgi:hypothetical protein